jgi:hypothetical protein
MIDRRQLKTWLETALAFANGPAPEPRTESKRDLSFDQSATKSLWTEWRQWLTDFQRDASRKKLQAWCLAHCVDERNTHEWNVGLGLEQLFSFDESGRPQLVLEASSLEGTLAIVGAELIAPDAPFGVAKCARPDCQRLIMKVFVRRPADGRPSEYCRLPDGSSHAFTSAERGRRARTNTGSAGRELK